MPKFCLCQDLCNVISAMFWPRLLRRRIFSSPLYPPRTPAHSASPQEVLLLRAILKVQNGVQNWLKNWSRFGWILGPQINPKIALKLVKKLIILGSIFGSLFVEALELLGCLLGALLGLPKLSWEAFGPKRHKKTKAALLDLYFVKVLCLI